MSMVYSLASSFLQDPESFNRGVWGVLFGEEIQLLRQERGISIEDAAERAGFRSKSGRGWRPARSPSRGNSCAPWPKP